MQLTAVQLALHSCLRDTDTQAQSVVISAFLVEDMALDRACALCHAGSTSLLEMVWRRGLRCIESSYWSVGKLVHTEPHYRQWVFERALIEAVQRKEVPLFRWLVIHFPSCNVTQEVADEMMKCGLESWLEQVRQDENRPRTRWKKLNLDAAAESGQWKRVHRLHERLLRSERQPKLSRLLVHYAFVQNNMKELQWAVAQGYPIRVYELPKCSKEERRTRKANARYLLKLEQAPSLKANLITSLLPQAAEAEDLEFVQWLLSHQLRPQTHVVNASIRRASERGNIPLVEFLIKYVKSRNISQSEAMRGAVEHGRLELVQWLYERYGRDPSSEIFCGSPLTLPHLGTFFSPTEMDVAARNGHLDVLQFLHRINVSTLRKRKQSDQVTEDQEKNYPHCTIRTMDAAAENGHLEIVKWLHVHRSEGCTSGAMDGAARNSHLNVVQWLHKHRKEGFTSNAMDGAAENGHLHMVQWLHKHTIAGCTGVAMDAAAKHGHVSVVKWLHDNRSEGRPATALNAAAGFSEYKNERQKLRVVRFLVENASNLSMATAMEKAVGENHFEILLFLYEHRHKFTDFELVTFPVKILERRYKPVDDEICAWAMEKQLVSVNKK